MKIADFRLQTSVPDAPGTSVVGVYADASGRLISRNSAGALFMVGSQVTGTVPAANVVSGALLGGTVSGWIPVIGPNNEKWAIPAYGRS